MTDAELLEFRKKHFHATLEETRSPEHKGERTLSVTYNGKQWHSLGLLPDEAYKVAELLCERPRGAAERFVWSDNTLVKRGKDFAEFLTIGFCEPAPSMPYTVYLCRYCVPGRCDTYHFDLSEDRRVRYSGERPEPMTKALAMLHADLEKAQVVAMLARAVEDSFGPRFTCARDLVEKLLPSIAPKSASLRACRKAFRKLRAERQKIIARRRAERQAAAEQAAKEESAS